MTPDAPALGQPARRLAAVAAADELVRVAHRHERDRGPGRGDPLDQAEAALERRAVRERDAGRPLERRAVGERIRVRQADLEEVGAGVDRRRGRPGSSSPRPGSRRRRTGSGPRDRRRRRRRRRPRSGARPAVSFVPVGAAAPAATARDHDPCASCQRPNVARSLSPRPDSPTSTTASSGQSPPAAFRPGEEPRQRRERVGRSRAPAGSPRSGPASASPRTPRRRSRPRSRAGRPPRARRSAARRPGSRGRPTPSAPR